jgi:hypothetical protein
MTFEDAMKIASELLLKLAKNHQLTDTQKDFVETAKELIITPMDYQSAYQRIKLNESKHPDIWKAVTILPTTVQKPIRQLTEDDLRYNLQNQLTLLAEKVLKEQN